MDQQKVWDNIATEWNKYRKTPMDEAAEFIKNKKGIVLDLGCGTGRNFAKIDGTTVGCDFSYEMLKLAKKKSLAELVKSDAPSLPFKDDSFDAILCGNSLHTVKFNKHKNVLSEIVRVAKDGAPVFISVWNKDQPRFAGSKKEAFIPWTASGIAYQRYYYLYSADELKASMKKYFSSVMVFGSSEKAFKRYSKDIIATARVAKSGQRRK